ncbi:hypothetical protein [Fusobacterium polymorphum]|uniref:hypothetical protein n=1 Tax=Fusobacterium nucleatum subsp. polymorphum TaxID=76857 RepID=UPI003009D373
MAKYTENIRLAQPEGSDYYDIEVFNHNSELIDKKIGEIDSSLSTIKEGATREKAGIVQYGTTEGKALEGMMLARLAGCVGYGGDIQEPGVKDINYLYYDRNTRKMYKCLNQNSDVSANVANFVPLDNNSLLDRLENLIKVEIVQMTNVLDYVPGVNVTEWYAPLPSHINVNKVISVTNVNQGNWGEYCNLDIPAKTIRVGALSNAKTYPLNQIQVIVSYLA